MNSNSCIFCRIIAGEAPASVIWRDDTVIAFMDTRPVNPGHVLVVPTLHANELSEMRTDEIARLFAVGQQIGAALRASGLRCEGINLLMADGKAAGQEVGHAHLHIIPRFAGDSFGLHFGPDYGRQPPREELDAAAAAIRLRL